MSQGLADSHLACHAQSQNPSPTLVSIFGRGRSRDCAGLMLACRYHEARRCRPGCRGTMLSSGPGGGSGDEVDAFLGAMCKMQRTGSEHTARAQPL